MEGLTMLCRHCQRAVQSDQLDGLRRKRIGRVRKERVDTSTETAITEELTPLSAWKCNVQSPQPERNPRGTIGAKRQISRRTRRDRQIKRRYAS